MRINIEQNREMARLFLKNKVYTFVNEYRPNGLEFQYNGFIVDLKDDDTIVFFDIIKKREIFILLSFCSLDYSNGKVIPEEVAKKILEEKRDG